MRSLALPLVLSAAVGLSIAHAQSSGDASSNLRTITGTVKAVAPWSVALDLANDKSVIVDADRSTRVIGKGAGPHDLLLRKGRPNLQDVIKAGDRLWVSYRLSGRSLKAIEMRVSREAGR